MQITKRRSLIWLTAGLMITGLSSCLKNDTVVEPIKPQSYISIVNMSYKSPAVEGYFGGEKVTAPMNPGTFFSKYSPIDPALLNVSFKKASADSVVATLPTGQLYDSSSFYTVLLYDEKFGGAKAVRIQDDYTGLTNDKTSLRFYNLVPELASVDFFLNGEQVQYNRTPADNADISQYNEFQKYTANVYTIVAKKAGVDSIIATSNSFDLQNANAYTIMLKGRPGGVGDNAIGFVVLRAQN